MSSLFRMRLPETLRERSHLGLLQRRIHQAQHKNPDQLDAWDRTVRAHWHVRRFTCEDLAEARRLLSEAIALNPTSSTAMPISPLPGTSKRCLAGVTVPTESHSHLGRGRAKGLLLLTMPTRLPIRRWQSLSCFPVVMRRPAAASIAPWHSIQIRSLLAAILASVMHSAATIRLPLEHLDEAIRLSPRGLLVCRLASL